MPTAPIGRTHDCKRFQRASSKKLLRLGGHPHMTEPLMRLQTAAYEENSVLAIRLNGSRVDAVITFVPDFILCIPSLLGYRG
jgi:hypothetical protein